MVHEVAAAGFADPADYDASRPSYPETAVAWLVEQAALPPGGLLADVAAGTGKLTARLRPHADRLVAVEPVAGMRGRLAVNVPGIPAVAGTAEALPFRTGAVDAVTVAQAWHWFDPAGAAAEMRRVLRRDGRLLLTWNARDRSVPWIDALWQIMDGVEKRAPWRDHERAQEPLPMPGFAEVATAEFGYRHALPRDQVVRRVASVSHVRVLPERERAAVLEEVRRLLETAPDTRGRERVDLVYRTQVYAWAPS